MTISFCSLNHPVNIWGHLDKHRSQHATRTNPILAIPPSSILLQTDESDHSHGSKQSSGLKSASSSRNRSDSMLNQRNAIGIIGGASVRSTLSFLKKLAEWSGENGLPMPFVLSSDPLLSKELLAQERSYFASHAGRSERFQLDDTAIVETLRRKSAFLKQSGARCIVMPCHVFHLWHDEVSMGCSVPFLHMGECVARELKDAKLKPLEAGNPLKIGVLGTNATLTAGFYQEKLQNEGFEVVLPDKATMEHTVIPAIEALKRKDIEGAQNLLRIALQVLLVRAVNMVVLASDDMRDLLPGDDPLLKKCIDPMDSLARSTIKWAQSAAEST